MRTHCEIFGNGYYAPVAINIALTAFIAFLGARLAIIRFGMSKFVSKLFFIYLFFHPDIFAWSNVMNGKDILVLLMIFTFFDCDLYFSSTKLPNCISNFVYCNCFCSVSSFLHTISIWYIIICCISA